MTTSRFRRATLGACVVAAMVVYFWPSRTPADPHQATPSQQLASTALGTPSPTSPAIREAPSATQTPVTRDTPSSSTVSVSDPDRRPPAPVSSLALVGNTDTTFTVSWMEATDANRYEVLVNGFVTATVRGTYATFVWPEDVDEILIQVAALDASGNRSEWRSIVIIPPAVIVVTAPPSTVGPPPVSSSTPATPGPPTPSTGLTVAPTDGVTPPPGPPPASSPPAFVPPTSHVEPVPPIFTATPWPSESATPTVTATPIIPSPIPSAA